MTTNERLTNVYDYLKKHRLVYNQSDFSSIVAQPRSVISEMMNNKRDVSEIIVRNICDKFDVIDYDWLLYGEGEMLKPTAKEEKVTEAEEVIASSGNYKLVPLYNFDAVGGMCTSNDVMDTPSFVERYIPFIDARDEDMCIPITGNSMIPAYSPGSIVLLREVIHWREYFGYGHVFVLFLTDGRRIIKEVRKSEENPRENVLCVSYNYESSAPEDLPKNMIYKVYKVIKVLTNEGF